LRADNLPENITLTATNELTGKRKAPCGAGIIDIVHQIREAMAQPVAWAVAVALAVVAVESLIFSFPFWVPRVVPGVPVVPEVQVECP
jgi:hypothetical protein